MGVTVEFDQVNIIIDTFVNNVQTDTILTTAVVQDLVTALQTDTQSIVVLEVGGQGPPGIPGPVGPLGSRVVQPLGVQDGVNTHFTLPQPTTQVLTVGINGLMGEAFSFTPPVALTLPDPPLALDSIQVWIAL